MTKADLILAMRRSGAFDKCSLLQVYEIMIDILSQPFWNYVYTMSKTHYVYPNGKVHDGIICIGMVSLESIGSMEELQELISKWVDDISYCSMHEVIGAINDYLYGLSYGPLSVEELSCAMVEHMGQDISVALLSKYIMKLTKDIINLERESAEADVKIASMLSTLNLAQQTEDIRSAIPDSH